MSKEQSLALQAADDLKAFGAESSLARHQAANALHRLHQAVAKLHAAKGRHHTQIAAAELFELCGLTAERPKK